MAENRNTGAHDADIDAGSSTDQHITGAPETEDSPVDAEPTATTPAHGSSNAGLNAAGKRGTGGR